MKFQPARLLAFASLCAAALLSSCSTGKHVSKTGPDGGKNEAKPQEFSAFIGGFLGASYRVELDKSGDLIYSHNPHTLPGGEGTERETLTVTEADWQAFRKELDAARVWTWRREYLLPDVSDGTMWNLSIRYPDAAVASRGDNAFPSKKQFERYLHAVQKLLGDKTFR